MRRGDRHGVSNMQTLPLILLWTTKYRFKLKNPEAFPENFVLGEDYVHAELEVPVDKAPQAFATVLKRRLSTETGNRFDKRTYFTTEVLTPGS